ncbi:MAG: signal peptide peptidase SppA [Chitinophagales bacterium]|nr:signal peptide peptidase SppA [Chitinophagales bacterium]
MKSFFTTVFGSCLGVLVAVLLGFLIMMGIAASAVSGISGSGATYSDNTILKLSLEEFIPEKSDNVTQSLSFSEMPDAIGLRQIQSLLETAADDPKIKGILIENNNVMVGQASLLSLMKSLKDFKASGKFIYSYADNHSQSSYLLCTVADSMFLNPQGGVDLRGFGASIPFFKGMLDKVGVEMNIFYAGNFKSATEPFRLTEMSEYNRIQTRAFLQDMESVMVGEISKNRGLSEEKIIAVMDGLEGRTAKRALENGLVDALYYKDQLDDRLREDLGIKPGKKIKTVSLSQYNTLATKSVKSTSKNKIAILYAEGEIGYGKEELGSIDDKRYLRTLQKIRNDDNVKAVVLRVNSPGGSAFTSEIIWREIEKIKEAGKLVVASFGDYAASGGYYISSGADYIFAQPNTLTGSIGVFMMLPDATKLLNDKLGVKFDTIKTHELATGFSPVLKLTSREKELLQESTLEIYDLFLERVSKGRKLSIEDTKEIAQGRVWTGRAGLEIGLVDALGDLDDAIKMAAMKVGLDDYKVVEYPYIEEEVFVKLMKEIQRSKGGEDESLLFNSKDEKRLLEMAKQTKALLRLKEPQARLPYIFEWN